MPETKKTQPEKTQIKVDSRLVRISHPQRVVFPEDGFTKWDLIDYYRRIAGVMLPHIRGRPLSMFRFHGDIRSQGFFQQNIPVSAPSWVQRVTVKKEGGTTTHILGEDAATLVYLANQNCITPHIWLSRVDHLDHPDQMIFDLDPSNHDFELVRKGARFLKSILDDMKLPSFVKTTGSRGLHVVIPIQPRYDFEAVHSLADRIAGEMTRRDPEIYTTEQRIEKRRGRLFIDTLRNSYAHTAVAPYAVRSIDGAPIAAPLSWKDLDNPDLTARSYNIRNIFARLQKTGDPWAGLEEQCVDLSGKI